MLGFSSSNHLKFLCSVSFTLLSLILVNSPTAVFAHAGHGDEFHNSSEATQSTDSIQVDVETAKRIGIKIEPVKRQQLAVGIKTTGQIETLPNQKVEVKAPVDGTLVELLVKPGDQVSKGQPVAVLSSSELASLRVDSAQKRAEAEPDLQKAQADLQLAKANYERQQTLVTADLKQAQAQLALAQERYDKDKELVAAGAIPRRQLLENEAKLTETKAIVAKAASNLPVLEAEAQMKRAQAAVEVSQSRIRLSNAGYEARLQQLGTRANDKGLVTVVSPISGTIADREITLNESVKAAEKPLMSILNDSSVLATANIYEKDLNQVQKGQQVRVKIASLANRTFTGKIALIGSVVEGGTRVIPVKAELDNSDGVLKPGMFAELEVLTDKTPTAILAIPTSAIVDANGKKLVYVQNGNAFQPTEVNLGQTSGDMVEIKSGLFDGDAIVTQRAPQLYAQSLRGGSKTKTTNDKPPVASQITDSSKTGFVLPWWWVILAGGVIVAGTFSAGVFWANRRNKSQLSSLSHELVHLIEDSPTAAVRNGHSISKSASPVSTGINESPSFSDNHHVKSQNSENNSHLKSS